MFKDPSLANIPEFLRLSLSGTSYFRCNLSAKRRLHSRDRSRTGTAQIENPCPAFEPRAGDISAHL